MSRHSSSSSSSSFDNESHNNDSQLIQKFPAQRERFNTWRIVMQAHFQSKGLWSVVEKGVVGMPITQVDSVQKVALLQLEEEDLNDELNEIDMEIERQEKKEKADVRSSSVNSSEVSITTTQTQWQKGVETRKKNKAAAAAAAAAASSSDTKTTTTTTTTTNTNISILSSIQSGANIDIYEQREVIKEKIRLRETVRKSNRAFDILLRSFNHQQIILISRVYTGNACEVWKIINKTYGDIKTVESTSSLYNQLTNIQMIKNESMVEYLNRIKEITFKLEVSGSKVNESLHKYYITLGLQKSSEWSLDMKLLPKFDRDDAWSVDELESYLLTEANKMIVSTQLQHAHSAYNNNNNDKDKLKNIECFYCKKKGHTKRDCRKFAADNKRNGDNNNDKNGGGDRRKNVDKDKDIEKECYCCKKKGHMKVDCFFNPDSKSYKPNLKGNKNKETAAAASTSTSSKSSSSQQDQRERSNSYITICTTPHIIEHAYSTTNKNEWVLDSGASRHFTCSESQVYEIKDLDEPEQVKTANGMSTYNQVGRVKVKTNGSYITLKDVACVPEFDVNLMSVSKLTDKGLKVIYEQNKAKVMENDRVLFTAIKRSGLYIIETEHALIGQTNTSITTQTQQKTTSNQAQTDATNSNTSVTQQTKVNVTKVGGISDNDKSYLRQIHCFLGHMSYSKIDKIIKNQSVKGIDYDKLKNIKNITEMSKEECVGCVKAKMCRSPLTGNIEWHAYEPLDVVCADTMGPFLYTSIHGEQHTLIMIDVGTRYIDHEHMKHRDESDTHIINTITELQTQFNKKLKRFHTDNAKELISKTVRDFLSSNGTIITETTAYTPEYNAIVERANRTIVEMTKAMMFHCDCYVELWSEAMNTSVYLLRRSITAADPARTPHELRYGKKPNITNLHTFGCDVWVLKQKQTREGKFDENAYKGIFVGYELNNGAIYRIFNPNTGEIDKSRDVKFFDDSFKEMKKLHTMIHEHDSDELYVPDTTKHTPSNPISTNQTTVTTEREKRKGKTITYSEDDALSDNVSAERINDLFANMEHKENQKSQVNNNTNTNINTKTPIKSILKSQTKTSESVVSGTSDSSKNVVADKQDEDERLQSKSNQNQQTNTNINTSTTHSTAPTTTSTSSSVSDSVSTDSNWSKRPARVKKRTIFYDPSASTSQANVSITTSVKMDYTPNTYKQAMKCDDRDKWLEAIVKELKSQQENGTWIEVAKQDGMNVIGCKWVFKIKRDSTGKIEKYKARLVAQGFKQVYGVDYLETFAPVMKYKTLRLMLALARTNTQLIHIDFTTAYLNAFIKEDIYMNIPEGMQQKSGMCVKLKKALYGTKQAGREWHLDIRDFLIQLGLTQLVKDTCIFIKKTKTNKTLIIGLFVDDLAVSFHIDDKSEWCVMLNLLKSKYKLSELGDMQHLLGMRITRINNNKQIIIDQQSYTQDKVNEFIGDEHKTSNTPEDQVKLNKKDGELLTQTGIQRYQGITGSLIYAAISTRPDIAHAVNMISRYMSQPTQTHMNAATKILRYLSQSTDMGLLYDCNDSESVSVTAYCDSDWGGCADDSKSTTGFCTFVNDNLIAWNTHKQQTVALSSAEAELMAIVDVVKEVEWCEMILTEMNFKVNEPTIIFVDNQSAIKMVENDVEHDRSKHIRIKFHYIRQQIQEKRIKITWTPTTQQLADIFTKALGGSQFTEQRDRIMCKFGQINKNKDSKNDNNEEKTNKNNKNNVKSE